MEGSETYSYSKDERPRGDASKQGLNKMHGQENAHTPPFLLKIFDSTRSQWPPLLHANGPPTPNEESCPPLSMAPLLGKKNLGPGHWQGRGMVLEHCTPPLTGSDEVFV